MGTKWEQSGIQNPKMGTRGEQTDQSGNSVGSRTHSGNKRGSKWGQEEVKVGMGKVKSLGARDFILKPFLGLAWPHPGFYVEISRLEISS